MFGFLLLNLVGLTVALITHDNVIFNIINEVTTTRSHWLITFAIDFEGYEIFLKRLSYNVEMASCVADEVVKKYKDLRGTYFLESFSNLQLEIKSLNETHKNILNSYTDLKTVTARSRRAFLPISNVFKFLFGVPSNDNLRTVRNHIGKLANN